MYELYYEILFVLSLFLLLAYVYIWQKHFDVHITIMYLLVPITNLGFVLLARSHTFEEAIAANKLTFVGGCFQVLDIMFIVFSQCGIKLNRWLRTALVGVGCMLYLSAMNMGRTSSFYKSLRFERVDGVGYLIKEYNFMHTVFYVYVILCFAMSAGAVIYSYVRNKQVSRYVLILLMLPMVAAMLCFFVIRKLFFPLELIVAAHVFAQIVYLLLVWRLCLYDITDSAIDSLIDRGDTGLISFDFRMRYLASNETARHIMPVLNDLTVDHSVSSVPEMGNVLKWLKCFSVDDTQDKYVYETGDRIYLVTIQYLSDGRHRRGYQMFLTDDTKNQRYNADLKAEVAQKTAHIVEMHNNLVLSMATMVESRDNSTGGHIRRTSELVRLLVDEIVRDPEVTLPEEFCRDIVKAAPMHDLGKIAVDDAILRKPGRFTPEEFEKMKAHAAEGARIVHEILKETDDHAFHIIAENVAHYHHERWDGSGYPEGLKGEEIPLEARIMAIADVYDALVSKRVYKERMSFEQADSIIMEGMGKHFDKRLEQYYVAARPAFEAYYTKFDT